jgi:hypothetical protein
MRHFNITLLLGVMISASCTSNKTINEIPCDLVIGDLGISIESFKEGNQDFDRYNKDNQIFIPGRIFFYSYEYYSRAGEKKYFNNYGDSWELISTDSSSDYTVKYVLIEVLNGLSPMIETDPEYDQTVLEYKFNVPNGYENSGVIENCANIWMHPPRTYLFKILQLNPYPYVKMPLKIRENYSWDLGIGAYWGDPYWLEWQGEITNNMTYEVIEERQFQTYAGIRDCFKIEAQGSSELGNTKAIFWFNEKLGFVRMDFLNIDGSQIILNLDSIE